MGYTASNKRIVMNVELGRTWKKVVTFLRLLYQNFPEGTVENHENPRIVTPCAKKQSTRYETGMLAFKMVTNFELNYCFSFVC
jgi:hypothetical protein